jgi:hypothetical protein
VALSRAKAAGAERVDELADIRVCSSGRLAGRLPQCSEVQALAVLPDGDYDAALRVQQSESREQVPQVELIAARSDACICWFHQRQARVFPGPVQEILKALRLGKSLAPARLRLQRAATQ